MLKQVKVNARPVMLEGFMDAKEARKITEENCKVIDAMTQVRVEDHIREATKKGGFSVVVDYYVPESIKQELRKREYSVNTAGISTRISW